jgi:hypothetical protein
MMLFLINLVSAQSLSGDVQDDAGKAMPFVNVLLLNENDSSLVKGAASNDAGYYTIDKVKPGRFLLVASMLGYKANYVPVVIADHDMRAPLLVMTEQAQQLKEISIVSTRPFIEQAIDRTIVNVSNSIISGGSTALEVLEKSPGISIDRQNDGISLRGKDGVIVLIDGKQTYLSMSDVVAMLRTMPSDNIDRIELITNPPAKYDAAGNSGIINIVLKKNENYGTNGSLTLAGGKGGYDRERGSMQINNRSKNLNLFANVGANRSRTYWDVHLSRKQDNHEGGLNYVDQQSYIRFFNHGMNVKGGMDYSLGPRSTIGLVYTAFRNSRNESSPASTTIRDGENASPYLDVITDKTISDKAVNQVGNINFQHDFKGNGGKFSADFDMGRFNRSYENRLITTTLFSENPPDGLEGLFTGMPTQIEIMTFKADYSRTLSKEWKLDAGIKSSHVFSDNDVTLSRGPVDNMEKDEELSNHFQYTEKVNAAYGSVAGKLSGVEIQAGLRAEHTHSVGESLTLDQRVTRDYLNLFPSVFLKRTLSPKQSLALSYSYRIDRPSYPNLNPARSYLDPYAFSRGNAYLKPQYTHATELKYGFDNKLFVSVAANFVQDFVFFLIQPVDAQTFERTPGNIGTSRVYNVNMSYPVEISKGWTFQTNFTATYSILEYDYMGSPLSVEQFTGRFNGSNSIILGKEWTAEASGWVSTPGVYAIFHVPWLGSLDLGIQKKLNPNMRLKLSAQDVLYTNRARAWASVAGFDQRVHIKFDTRVFMLTLTCSFGNQKVKGERQRKTASEEEVQRTN